jgi:hypothetical protein
MCKKQCDDCPVITGKDARRLVKAMKNPKPVSKEEYERVRELYNKVNANSKTAERKGIRALVYLGSTQTYPLDNVAPVYMVMSIRFDNGAKIWSENRTWGWLPTLAHARKTVAMNSGDMHETTFNYVIIEKVPAGICVENEVVDVYKWLPDKRDKNHWHGKWVKCQKPKWMGNTSNWTIG